MYIDNENKIQWSKFSDLEQVPVDSGCPINCLKTRTVNTNQIIRCLLPPKKKDNKINFQPEGQYTIQMYM
jgi:hypothetical protein